MRVVDILQRLLFEPMPMCNKWCSVFGHTGLLSIRYLAWLATLHGIFFWAKLVHNLLAIWIIIYITHQINCNDTAKLYLPNICISKIATHISLNYPSATLLARSKRTGLNYVLTLPSCICIGSTCSTRLRASIETASLRPAYFLQPRYDVYKIFLSTQWLDCIFVFFVWRVFRWRSSHANWSLSSKFSTHVLTLRTLNRPRLPIRSRPRIWCSTRTCCCKHWDSTWPSIIRTLTSSRRVTWLKVNIHAIISTTKSRFLKRLPFLYTACKDLAQVSYFLASNRYSRVTRNASLTQRH